MMMSKVFMMRMMVMIKMMMTTICPPCWFAGQCLSSAPGCSEAACNLFLWVIFFHFIYWKYFHTDEKKINATLVSNCCQGVLSPFACCPVSAGRTYRALVCNGRLWWWWWFDNDDDYNGVFYVLAQIDRLVHHHPCGGLPTSRKGCADQ